MDTSMLKFAKPELRATIKRRKARNERSVAQSVRAQCVKRDGRCRASLFSSSLFPEDCFGPSEWCHFGDFKRARTRGQAAERRHTTAGSLMMCRKHHREYDAGRLIIKAVDPVRGCDGELWLFWKDEA